MNQLNKDKLLEIYHYRRQQYLNREDSDLKILQGLLWDLKGLVGGFDVSEERESMDVKPAGLEIINENTPWYPDDSGEWIEYDGSGQPVENNVIVDVIIKGERERKYYAQRPEPAYRWSWDWSRGFKQSRIVAYKIVKE